MVPSRVYVPRWHATQTTFYCTARLPARCCYLQPAWQLDDYGSKLWLFEIDVLSATGSNNRECRRQTCRQMLLVDGRPESDRQVWGIVRQGLRLWSTPMWPFHPSPHLLADAGVFHLEHRLLNARRTRQHQVLTSFVSKTQNLLASWQGLRSRRCGGRAEALTGCANRKHDVSARGCMCSTSRTSSWSGGSRHISAPNCFRSGKRAAAEDFAIFVIKPGPWFQIKPNWALGWSCQNCVAVA